MSLVNVECIRGFRGLVTDLGGDPDALLGRARIRPEALADSRNFIAFESVIRLLEYAATTLSCPDFGLRLASRHDIGILGPLAIAVRNSTTLGEALACASRYMFTHSPAIAFVARPAERADRVLVAYEISLRVPQAVVQEIELTVASVAHVVSLLSGGRHHLRRVHFPHRRNAPASAYRDCFGVAVLFERQVAALEIDAADLSLSIPSGHPELRQLAEHYLESQFGAQPTPLGSRVRELLHRSFGTGRTSSTDVASALGMHPRTMQRRLEADGASFDAIKDEVRADLAKRYLAEPDLPMSRVAALLDYSEQSALTRSCHRWFGCSPRALRSGAGLAEEARRSR